MALRLVVNAKFQPGFSVFLMLRKEARAAFDRYLASKASLRRVERRLGKLDALGAGRGLPRSDVFRYNGLVREARMYTEQMEAWGEVLARYGMRLDAEMKALSASTSVQTKVALIGRSMALAVAYKGESPSLHDLVVRDRLEEPLQGAEGPVLACLLAARGELLRKRNQPRQAFQMHRFAHLGDTTFELKAVACQD
ncbi:TPA: hypothetical protein ACKP9S_002785 [Pseudomonas aeruginosa]